MAPSNRNDQLILLRDQIVASPDNLELLTIARLNFGKDIPINSTGEAIMDIFGTATPPAAAAPFGRRTPLERRYISVTFSLTEEESGTCRYTHTRSYSGEMDVPDNVVAEGEESIEDYVRINYYDFADDDEDDYEYSDYESTNSEVTSEDINSSLAMDEWESRHPDEDPIDR